MKDTDVATLAETMGEYLHAFRVENGFTLESVCSAARKFGATWNLSSIRAIETGNAAPSLPNLILIALVVSELTGKDITLADVLNGAERVRFPTKTDGQSISIEWLARVLKGSPVSTTDEGAPERVEALSDARVSLVVRRAATRLRVSPDLVETRAQSLWGKSFQAEVYSRSGVDTTPQKRGRVTRTLIDEIQASIDARQTADALARQLATSLVPTRV